MIKNDQNVCTVKGRIGRNEERDEKEKKRKEVK